LQCSHSKNWNFKCRSGCIGGTDDQPAAAAVAAAAIRIALLTFTSLGFRVPFRLHLVLQTINVAIFITFGLHPYCHSKVRCQ
jgi:hypothetical protein